MELFGKKRVRAQETETGVTGAEVEKIAGSYDEAGAPEDGELLRCGTLRLPPVEGITVQLTVEYNHEVVLDAVYIAGENVLQLQVFVAPKSSDLQSDVHTDMVSSIASQGGPSCEIDGKYGREIHTQIPIERSRTINPVRYLGIGELRWLPRTTLTDRAAVDDTEARNSLYTVLNGLVVVKGVATRPLCNILPSEAPRSGNGRSKPQHSRLSLPRRKPEISEVR